MIETGILDGVAKAAGEASPALADIELQNALRGQFGGLRIVVCSDDDIPARISPVTGNARCNLYFLDASEHCVKLTDNAEIASGLVVGLIVGDGE